ncbi:MAG: aldo/keto reductase [Lachnospiraceae bacterium]|nr:aldo/keto reductase [Lachnospiraceae bacterium]
MKNTIPQILIGTFQVNTQEDMDKIVCAAVESKNYAFDTAPSYGSEKMLGNSLMKLIKNGIISRENLYLQDKIDAIQMYYCEKVGIYDFVQSQLSLLNTEYLDSLLVHWPFRKYFIETWKCMQELKEEGIIKQVGVCNLDVMGYQEIFVQNNLIQPDIIQNEISPLNTDRNATDFFIKHGIYIEAYSPLCRMDSRIKENIRIKSIADAHSVDVARVVLKWHIQKNISPIFTSKKAERIVSNTKLDFELQPDEIDFIDSLNENYKIFPISHGCPGY